MSLIVIHFARFGPYHHARLKSAAEALAPFGWEVIGLETAGNDSTYAWDETSGGDSGTRVITAFPGRLHEEITSAECKRVLHPLLNGLKPDAMAIAGWAATDALSCLSWCRKNDKTRIVMSETREADGKRVWWKERIKRYLISRFDGALVGGKSHRDYLVKLGMPADKIRFGYNVVDNAYYAEECLNVRKSKVEGQEQQPYFLASNRFIERKNLPRLIEAYSSYVQKSKINNLSRRFTPAEPKASTGSTAATDPQSSIWPLCLLGDGEQKTTLIARCHELGLQVIESAPWEVAFSKSTINNQQSTIINHQSGQRLFPDSCLLPPASRHRLLPGFPPDRGAAALLCTRQLFHSPGTRRALGSGDQ
jgi:1,2-diacylglycerol 3-alpha-glucosyltransferase